ncbi:GM11345 [Drosophila sechellia]|uniref:GM11345 n=1 Tax=Drosophila sechellia TaxID=7238 RepID=B4IDJ8_DROSE|nr:GM11345 [Drosophila sechellia]
MSRGTLLTQRYNNNSQLLWQRPLFGHIFGKFQRVESRRVIFLKPNGIHRGQILATHGMEKSCPKCHMLDHRGNCRRIIAYNADGVRC